ncbi:MAG: sulfite exporter TauE/SafE family protein [Pseudomonadota bacterium]|nr:sulfite exporter TauE/SafE family protein [Pseudomonadota bacterium]MEC9382795.1 sulfite exporter TauE/SafE family protein [Pseudomonadota bacterium]MEC9459042.1 sulfite exporter TauE/SafE family protein [Pseudomonadota bacterium]MEC9481189.1 sulfite exporter TauE/SafE family protein [Pseudomonadota bacterium]
MYYNGIGLIPFIIALALSGIFSGFLAGLLGVGGGIIVVPVLYHVLLSLGFSQDIIMHVSVATSLAIIIPTGWRSYVAHKKNESVDNFILKKWLIPTLIGSAIGAVIAGLISGFYLTFFFATIALLVCINLFLSNEDFKLSNELPSGLFSLNIPLFVGAFSSMLGIGGGTFNVSIMSLYGVPIHKAVGTSAGLGFFLSIPGTLFFILTGFHIANLPPMSLGYVNILGLLLIAPLAAISAPLGAKYAHSLPKKILTRIFAIFLLFTSVRMYLELF